jgi:DNA-binding GntR family transcriptional regulator
VTRVFEERLPLYQTVAERLALAIERGVYPPGGMLPSQATLCMRFGVGRHTVQKALRLLLQLGLVSSHEGIGTRVDRSTVPERYVQRFATLPK